MFGTEHLSGSKWPKIIPPLTPRQRVISDDFMKVWHETLPRYGAVEKFNHGWVARNAPKGFTRTLEIGAGLGEHLAFERLSVEQTRSWVAVDYRENMAAEIQRRYPQVQTIVADCQQRFDLPDGYFDRIIAVHVLEHLPNLPAAVSEMHRLCDKDRGVFQVVIPCEGSPAYTFCRKISAERLFKKRYKQSYKWFIEREHINRPFEILKEIEPYFEVERRSFFPVPLPFVWCNLCIGLNLKPKRRGRA